MTSENRPKPVKNYPESSGNKIDNNSNNNKNYNYNNNNNEIRLFKRKREETFKKGKRYGPLDAVEEIEFQLPTQTTNADQKTNKTDSLVSDLENEAEWLDKYGRPDPTVAPSRTGKCPGCGAQLHCQDSSLPGFVPVEVFLKSENLNKFDPTLLCRRCHLLKEHNFLLNVTVSPADYATVMGRLRMHPDPLLLILVDLTDFPASLYSHLPQIVGQHKPVFIVGNKVDLLPIGDQEQYLRHFKHCLQKAVDDIGFSKQFNVLHVGLISAKTGYGIEDLITNIFLMYTTRRDRFRGDIYLIGCTNTGKSSLFNAFLQSDLCKVRVMDLVERASTSLWPGTTLNLLKFPVMSPNPLKLEVRRRRLMRWNAWKYRQERLRLTLSQRTGQNRFALLQETVENSFLDTHEYSHRNSQYSKKSMERMENGDCLFIDMDQVEAEQTAKDRRRKSWNPEAREFAEGVWCYDTPGVVSENQIINKLTLTELVSTIPRQQLVPRTHIVWPGETLLIAALARVDFQTNHSRRLPIFLTVFASDKLPINVMKTGEISAFVRKYLGTKVLEVPYGDQHRLAMLPKLKPVKLSLTGLGRDESSADITLSSTGWLSFTGDRDVTADLQIWTPGGAGVTIRRPPLLPQAVNQKGRRIVGTSAYEERPLTPEDSLKLSKDFDRKRRFSRGKSDKK